MGLFVRRFCWIASLMLVSCSLEKTTVEVCMDIQPEMKAMNVKYESSCGDLLANWTLLAKQTGETLKKWSALKEDDPQRDVVWAEWNAKGVQDKKAFQSWEACTDSFWETEKSAADIISEHLSCGDSVEEAKRCKQKKEAVSSLHKHGCDASIYAEPVSE